MGVELTGRKVGACRGRGWDSNSLQVLGARVLPGGSYHTPFYRVLNPTSKLSDPKRRIGYPRQKGMV